MESKRILLLEPDAKHRRRTVALLERVGATVAIALNPADAQEELQRRRYDAVLFPFPWSPPEAGAAPGELAERASGALLIALCNPEQLRAAARSLPGAIVDEYLLRPPEAFEVRYRLRRILERHELDSRISFYQDEISKRHGVKNFEIRSPAMRAAFERILRVAPLRTTVLIRGESGVGKELAARAIHFHSPRRDAPFVALNCAAIPAGLIDSELFGHERGAFTGAHARVRGKFEIAHPGTLFLDEIGEMTPATQAKLLRVLEARELMRVGGDQSVRVDVRVIAATNADLETMVDQGRFRRDLYYRLKVVMIDVPPLRERRADLPYLVRGFLDELARSNAVGPKSISPEALLALTEYGWPGNVRELKNQLESLLVSTAGDAIRLEDLPRLMQGGSNRPERRAAPPLTTLAEAERDLIRRTLDSTGGNRTHSADLLAIAVRTLQRKIHAYGLPVPPRRRRRRQRPS